MSSIREKLSFGIFILFLVSVFYPVTAGAQPKPDEQALVEMGRDLFFNRTFGGNGRTCGTCHPQENNFTIDPNFIATLPNNDPLFVAEFDPKLTELEDSVLLRKFGLILENLDGFDKPPVFRSVPHNLAMRTSIDHDDSRLTALGKGHSLGWSGDGAPNPAFIQDFITGAVIQHYPKTLARVDGEDFILPTALEKEAIGAFLLSVGRQKDINLSVMKFKNAFVELGKDLFFDPKSGPCNLCHQNAGASTLGLNGRQLNFAIGVENVPSAPHTMENPVQRDAGLGGDPNPKGGFGDDSFSPPPLIEAADTPPFFHNNAINNIEGAVAFYASDTFAQSKSAQAFGLNVQLETTEVVAIAALLRTLNALENIRSSDEQDALAKKENLEKGKVLIERARFETEDAYQVLDGMHMNVFKNAAGLLREAYALEGQALAADDTRARDRLLNSALALKKKAKGQMVN